MSVAQTKNRVSVPRAEYLRLKKIDEQFGNLLSYVNHLKDIAVARREIKQKKFLPQEKLFKQLGF